MKTNFNNLLEMVGNTPVVRINNIDTGPCELFVKLENLNPGGSIKDRVGIKIIEEAEKSGLYQLKGHRLVGGLRASIYNAMPVEGIHALINFMQDFEKKYL